MRILFAGSRDRGRACLLALRGAGHEIVGVRLNPQTQGTDTAMQEACTGLTCPVDDPSAEPWSVSAVRQLTPDLIVLAGYSPILPAVVLEVPPYGAVNLHGGHLPAYRGSSPMNWALIHGAATCGLSVIRVEAGIDTGPVLAEYTVPIPPTMTIGELHQVANTWFPQLLLKAIGRVARGEPGRRQSPEDARYLPLRCPDDGVILWELMTAEQVRNRIRALTRPYAGACTGWQGRRVVLYAGEHSSTPYLGEPGRVYRVTSRGLLIAAADRCLWITEAVMADTGEAAAAVIPRYATLASVRASVLAQFH